jgi:hypothetical protein
VGTREVFPWGLTDGDVNGWSWGSIGPSMWRMVSFSGMIGVACIGQKFDGWKERNTLSTVRRAGKNG